MERLVHTTRLLNADSGLWVASSITDSLRLERLLNMKRQGHAPATIGQQRFDRVRYDLLVVGGAGSVEELDGFIYLEAATPSQLQQLASEPNPISIDIHINEGRIWGGRRNEPGASEQIYFVGFYKP